MRWAFWIAALGALVLWPRVGETQVPFYWCQVQGTSQNIIGQCGLDPSRLNPVTIYLNWSSGASATANAELTADNPVTLTSGNWQVETNLSGKSANTYDTFTGVATAVRLNITSYSSGTVTMTVVGPSLNPAVH